MNTDDRQPPPRKPRVILRRVGEYDEQRIRAIAGECIDELGVPLPDPVFVKPNIVTANRRYIHHSYTHPAVTAGVVLALRERGCRDVTIGESGGFGIPTPLFLAESGYAALARRLGVPLIDLNGDRLRPTRLDRALHHREILLAESIARAATKVWLPKLKYHIFCGITFSLKLNIGILTHPERMLFHDWRIHDKIVDLLEAGRPRLVIGDAIDITYGFESAPYPARLGCLMAADDPLAADAVAARMMGYEPGSIEHLRLASGRGYGSLEPAAVEVLGDVSIDELRAVPKGRPRLFQVLAELETPIRFYEGVAAESGRPCDGGCSGALKGCLGTIEKRRPGSLARARTGAIVTGLYRGDVVTDGPALLIGDCTRVEGSLVAARVVRVAGCPTAARGLLVKLPFLFKLPSPMLDPRDALLFVWFSLRGLFGRAWRRLFRPAAQM